MNRTPKCTRLLRVAVHTHHSKMARWRAISAALSVPAVAAHSTRASSAARFSSAAAICIASFLDVVAHLAASFCKPRTDAVASERFREVKWTAAVALALLTLDAPRRSRHEAARDLG